MKNVLKAIPRAMRFEQARMFFIVYFSPVFTVVMLGYYFNNDVVRSVFSLSQSFHWLNSLLITLIVISVLARFLSEITGHILSGFRHLFYWLKLLIYNISNLFRNFSLIKSFRKRLHNNLTTGDVHLDPIRLREYLDEHPHVREWYMSHYAYSTALQSALGAFIVMFFLYQGGADFPIGSLLILFIFAAYISKHQLIEAHRSLYEKMSH